MPELQYIPITSKSNILQSIKDICKTDIILIATSASAVMSIIQIWQQYQLNLFYFIYQFEANQKTDESIFALSFAISEFPIVLSIMIAYRMGNKIKKEIDALQYLNNATSSSLVYFILGTLQLTCRNSLMGLQIFISILIITMQQYYQTILSISSTILIGIQNKNQRTLGLSFGILSMSSNLFGIWVICVLSQLKADFYQKMTVIYGFAICYSILGATLAKMLQFVRIIKINQPSDIMIRFNS